MSNKAWSPRKFLREVSNLFKCQNLFIYLDYPETAVLSCVIKYVFPPKQLPVPKTTSKYIAGLQDPFKDKYMKGKSNYKLKSLIIFAM